MVFLVYKSYLCYTSIVLRIYHLISGSFCQVFLRLVIYILMYLLMERSKELLPADTIYNRVYMIRGQQVMLDYDLAEIYGYEVKRLNEQVKNNISRFPEDFMFQLTKRELEDLRSNFTTTNINPMSRSLPHAFTEQGMIFLHNFQPFV